MRDHRQIIDDAGGKAALVNLLAPTADIAPSRVRFWHRRNSIPAEWWACLDRSGVASLSELAKAAEAKASMGAPAHSAAPDDAMTGAA